MYSQYWNLHCQPFENDADPAFFFRSRTHQAALLKLKYLIDANKGCGLLVGSSGAGKSYVTRLLIEELNEPAGPIIFVRYPLLSADELIAFVAAELGADEDALQQHGDRFDFVLRHLQARLAHFSKEGRHPLVVIEEAHLIEDQKVFQAIQLLLNYRDEARFTVLLCGQPALLSRIERLDELNERIGVKSLIHPLSRDETAEYVQHRLSIAGLNDAVFDESALNEIHELSGGIPRRINRIADLSLLVGYADSMSTIGPRDVESVADEIGLSIGG